MAVISDSQCCEVHHDNVDNFMHSRLSIQDTIRHILPTDVIILIHNLTFPNVHFPSHILMNSEHTSSLSAFYQTVKIQGKREKNLEKTKDFILTLGVSHCILLWLPLILFVSDQFSINSDYSFSFGSYLFVNGLFYTLEGFERRERTRLLRLQRIQVDL